jgi:hypothetical protein
MTTIDADGPAVTFTPIETTAPNAHQKLTLFTPPGANASSPGLLWSPSGNFLHADPYTQLKDDGSQLLGDLLIALYQRGFVIVVAGSTGFNLPTATNGGLWRPYDSLIYLNDWNSSWAERDFEMALQFVIQQQTAGLIQGSPAKLGGGGLSSGALSAMSCGLGPNRARASGSAQVRTSTSLAFHILYEPIYWWYGFQWATSSGAHWPSGGMGSVRAPFLTDVTADDMQRSSPARWMSDAAAAGVPRFCPTLIACDEPFDSTNFQKGASGEPLVQDTFTEVHGVWHSYMLRDRWRSDFDAPFWDAQCRFLLGANALVPPAQSAGIIDREFADIYAPDAVAYVAGWASLAVAGFTTLTPATRTRVGGSVDPAGRTPVE